MGAYYFEPKDGILEITSRDMKACGLETTAISEDWFSEGLPLLQLEGMSDKGVIIADTPRSLSHVQAIRKAGCKNPILVILDNRNSARTVEFLNAGADDVMVRPFKAPEVKARLHTILRRNYGHAGPTLKIGDLTVYFDGSDPEVNGVRIKLSQREHAIFNHLAQQPGRVIKKEALFQAVYQMRDNQPFDKVVDVYICKLRKKIREATGGHQYIETVYGRGYKITAPDADKAKVPQIACDAAPLTLPAPSAEEREAAEAM